jgi:uncharacterized short protein YbdD (DUF466 family)
VSTCDKEAATSIGAASVPTISPGRRWAERVRALRQACRQLFGIPDYERYLAHVAEHHAGETVLSRRDFFIRSIDRKYGKSGPRCC